MKTVQKGSTVRLHYSSALAGGDVLHSTFDNDPVLVTIGTNELIPGFEEALLGMQEGERKTFLLPKAFGEYQESLLVTVDRSDVPEDIELVVGENYQITTPDQQTFEVWVKEITEESVVLDANHPLAGKDIEFTVEIIEVL